MKTEILDDAKCLAIQGNYQEGTNRFHGYSKRCGRCVGREIWTHHVRRERKESGERDDNKYIFGIG